MRIYHSASSIALGARCQRAWAYQYIDGIRDPDVTWEAIEKGAPHNPKQRSLALGKEVHRLLEHWYKGDTSAPSWGSLPGQIASSGMAWLPHPADCDARLEDSIGSKLMPPGVSEHAPKTCLELHGIRWAGYKDLVALPTEQEAARLSVAREWLLIDHKTSSSIARYSKSSAELHEDLQANLYAYDVCQWKGLESVALRWVYYETKKTRRSLAVGTRITRADASKVIKKAAQIAKTLDAIETSQDAPMNPEACFDYGGCPHHARAGGPCGARFSMSIAFRDNKKKRTPIMALDRSVIERFKKARNAPVEDDDVEPEEEIVEPEDEGDDIEGTEEPEPEPEPEPDPPKKARRGRPPKKQPDAPTESAPKPQRDKGASIESAAFDDLLVGYTEAKRALTIARDRLVKYINES